MQSIIFLVTVYTLISVKFRFIASLIIAVSKKKFMGSSSTAYALAILFRTAFRSGLRKARTMLLENISKPSFTGESSGQRLADK